MQNVQVCIIFPFPCGQEVDRSMPASNCLHWKIEAQGFASVSSGEQRREEMGGLLSPHHQTFPNSLRVAIPGSLSLRKDVLLFCSPRQGFPRSFCSAIIRSEANGAATALPEPVSKRSKEELVAFFRDMQTSIAESSPKDSRRTRKRSPDPFEDVDRREQSYGVGGGDGSAGDVSEKQRKVMNLENMKIADLRELARARRMRGYSKLKKGELIDRLKGAMQ